MSLRERTRPGLGIVEPCLQWETDNESTQPFEFVCNRGDSMGLTIGWRHRAVGWTDASQIPQSRGANRGRSEEFAQAASDCLASGRRQVR